MSDRVGMTDTLLANVRLLDPATGLDAHGGLLIRDGVIAGTGAALGRPDGAETIDGEGAVLCPGLVDMRAALGEPGFEYRETIASAAEAASAGGITTLAALPDSRPAIDDPALVRLLRARGEETGRPHHPALRRRHPRLPRRGAGGDRAAGRSRRGRLHRRAARDRRRPPDAPRAVLRARLRLPHHPAPGGARRSPRAAPPPRASWPPGSACPASRPRRRRSWWRATSAWRG